MFGDVPALAVLNISNPVAGEATGLAELVAVSAIRGGRNPLFVDFTSSIALESAFESSLLIATWLKV